MATVERLARLAQPVDEAVVVGQLGADRVAGERQLHGDVERDLAGQAEQAAGAGDERPLDLGDAERGGGGGDDQVAGQHDLGAAGQRRAVDGGDDRLGALAPARCRRSRPARSGGEPALPALISLRSAPAQNTGGSPVRMPTQMLSSASIWSIAVLDALGDGAVDGVAGLGAVDLDDRERSPLLEVDGHAGHLSHRPVLALIVQGRHPSPTARDRAGTMT